MESGHSGGDPGDHMPLFPPFLPRAGLWLLSLLTSAWSSFLHRTSGPALPTLQALPDGLGCPHRPLTEESTAVSNSEPSLQPRNSLRLCTPLRAAPPASRSPCKRESFSAYTAPLPETTVFTSTTIEKAENAGLP